MSDLVQQEWVNRLKEDDNSVIIDVRTEAEVLQGYIPNAIHIDIYKGQEFLEAIKALDMSKNYYVYCKAGGRSGQACSVMQQLGFENTYNLLGGFDLWKGEVVHNPS
ncbi:MAG: rhodanese-like domain-containing protein [Flavobacteriaceae bacterium]|nr:rhodanese-like domain-containing protein [Flavobacteriaceae bacterium]